MANKETPEQKKARETVEEIATTIAKLSRSVSAILEGRLKKQAVVVLLVHSTRMQHGQVEAVLDALTGMEAKWLK